MAAQEDLRYYYGDKRPNAIYTKNDTNIPLQGPTTTYLGNLIDQLTGPKNMANQRGIDRRGSPLEDGYLLANNQLSKTLLEDRNTDCQKRGSAKSTLEFLNNLATNVNNKSIFRCGWLYNNANPNQGQAYYGTIDGPSVDTEGATGTWMWDLNAAKKKLHLSICSGAKNCADVDNVTYNKFCGYCTTSKKFIPINGSVAAYPYDGNNACASSRIVLSASQCPQPAPPPPAGTPAAATWLANRQVCDPMVNGSVPRDCLIQKATQAGCKDQGTLITSLSSGSDTNYLDTLMQAASYSKYQELSGQALNETALKTGKITISDALSEFQAVYNSASRSNNLGLKAAAADLCFTKGSFDTYDFCTELQPTSRSPFSLECLQKAFKRAGGQETGSLYPKGSNMAFWNSNSTWRDVNIKIQGLQDGSISTDRKIQQRAIAQFQGIPLDDKTRPVLGLINNVEIFWFTRDPDLKSPASFNTTFLGRRIRSQIPTLPSSSSVPGAISSNTSFIYFTNMQTSSAISFNLQYTGDSGFIFARNRGSQLGGTNTIPMPSDYVATYNNNNAGNGITDGTNKEFSSLYPKYGNDASQTWTSQTYSTTTAWTINPNVPNIITGYYIGNGTNHLLQYAPTDTNAWTNIPGTMLYLIQDPYAPMVSFNVVQNYQDYNCTYPFMDKRLSSHKMQWKIYNNGPTPNYYSPGVANPSDFPLNLSYMRFANGSGIMSQFLLKVYSFVTLTYIVRFNTVPGLGLQSSPFVLWASYPSIDYPGIFLVGKGNNTAQINVGSIQNPTGNTQTQNAYGCVSPPKTSDGPIISSGNTYIITMTANRTNPSDIYSLNSLTVGAALLTDLQNNPSALTKTSPLVWPNPRSLDNPDSGASDFFLITGDANCQFDLFSLQMFDYEVSGENLGHVANDDWPMIPPNAPTTPLINQNPYA